MPKLVLTVTKMASAKNTMQAHGLKPKKSFGQNFMVDQRVNSVFTDTVASFGRNQIVVEIGAGTGSLTSHLLALGGLVHAIERDRDLVPILRHDFSVQISHHQLIIYEADGARFDLSAVLSNNQPAILVGNLPYHLTSSIIILALKNLDLLAGAVFLVQKEVADRLVAGPNCKEYGFLSAVLKLAFTIEKVADVDKSAFWPAPKIDSAIIKMTVSDRGISCVPDLEQYLFFVREIFQKRRKKLSTILKGKLSPEQWQQLKIDPNLRPENLSPEQFLAMFLS